MDKEISSVGTQYIICECGDNFPNERFLNIHLANGHGEVETFQCDACPEMFTSANALNRHIYTHRSDQPESPQKPEPTQKPELKTYSRKEVKQEKKPPVIKLKNLKRIDSISLIDNLRTYGKFFNIEPRANTQQPEPQPKLEPELPEQEPELPEPEPVSELPEPEPELPEPESEAEPESIFMEIAEEEGQVFVKNEKQETAENDNDEAEEIYYQCDVCNSIFYTEWDFNVHYQSVHALKLENTAEQILERHLVVDHADDEGVKAEADTAYYYECELDTKETDKSGLRSVIADGVTDDTLPDVRFDDANTQMYPASSKEDKQELDEKVQVKEVIKGGRRKKAKRGRPPKEDVYLNMPPGLTTLQKPILAKNRKIEIRKEHIRNNAESYRKIYPERRAEAFKKKDLGRVELTNKKATAKYAKNNPEVRRKAGKKCREKIKKEADKFKELEILEEDVDELKMNHQNLKDDVGTQIYPAKPEEENIQELDDHDLLQIVKIKEGPKRGRPKKVKKGRPPIIDVYLDMPPGLSHLQVEALAKKRRIEIRKEQRRKATKNYRKKKPESIQRANAKYAKNNPEVSKKSSKKYAQNNPEISRRSSKKYNERKKLEKQRMKEETMAECEKTDELKELNIKEEALDEIETEMELEIEFEEILGY